MCTQDFATRVQLLKNILDPSPTQLGVWGSAVSSASGVWGGAPAANDFGAFWTDLKPSSATWIWQQPTAQCSRTSLKLSQNHQPYHNFDHFLPQTLRKKATSKSWSIAPSKIWNTLFFHFSCAPNISAFRKHLNSELSTGHFSWTRPNPAKRWPDPLLPTKSLTRPDPTPPPPIYYVSWVQHSNCQQRIIYNCCMILRKIFLFGSCNVSREWKKDLKLIFQDRGLEATKRLQISIVSEVHSRFNLSRSELWSLNSFHTARFE